MTPKCPGMILPLLNVTVIGDLRTRFRWWDAVRETRHDDARLLSNLGNNKPPREKLPARQPTKVRCFTSLFEYAASSKRFADDSVCSPASSVLSLLTFNGPKMGEMTLLSKLKAAVRTYVHGTKAVRVCALERQR